MRFRLKGIPAVSAAEGAGDLGYGVSRVRKTAVRRSTLLVGWSSSVPQRYDPSTSL